MSTLVIPTPVKDTILNFVSKVPFVDNDWYERQFEQILDEHPVFCAVYFTIAAAVGIAAGVAANVWFVSFLFSLF